MAFYHKSTSRWFRYAYITRLKWKVINGNIEITLFDSKEIDADDTYVPHMAFSWNLLAYKT